MREANTAPKWVTAVMWWLPELVLITLTVLAAVAVGSLLVLLPLVVPAWHMVWWTVDQLTVAVARKSAGGR